MAMLKLRGCDLVDFTLQATSLLRASLLNDSLQIDRSAFEGDLGEDIEAPSLAAILALNELP